MVAAASAAKSGMKWRISVAWRKHRVSAASGSENGENQRRQRQRQRGIWQPAAKAAISVWLASNRMGKNGNIAGGMRSALSRSHQTSAAAASALAHKKAAAANACYAIA